MVIKSIEQITIQQRMWGAMRIMKQFSLIDLQVTSRGEEDLLNDEAVRSYVYFLTKYSYLKRIAKNWYSLEKNTGPFAPIIKKEGILFDDNTGETLETSENITYKDLITDYIKEGYKFSIQDLEVKFHCSSGLAKELIRELEQDKKLKTITKKGEIVIYQYIFKDKNLES